LVGASMQQTPTGRYGHVLKFISLLLWKEKKQDFDQKKNEQQNIVEDNTR
jgi:hypothetical protein